MSENSFALAFKGEVAKGYDIEKAKAGMERTFKASADKLFSGKPIALRKGLDRETAKKYQAALKKSGIITYVVNTNKAAAKPSAVATPADNKPSKPARPELRLASPFDQPQALNLSRSTIKRTATNLDALNGVEIDQPDHLVEQKRSDTPDIDTSGLNIAEVGAMLVEAKSVSALEVDTSNLSMAEAGVTLVKIEEVKPLDVDTSTLSMATPGVQLTEPRQEEAPDIDISRLSLSP